MRGLQASPDIDLERNAMPRKMRIGTANPTERRPLTPPLPQSGERSMTLVGGAALQAVT